MGLFGRLLGGLGDKSAPPCPSCGATLDGEGFVAGSYWCESCGRLFNTADDGELFYVRPLNSGGSDGCEMCQSSLSGGELTVPWEDGDNSHAYVVCPSCRHENIRYGFGEDDD